MTFLLARLAEAASHPATPVFRGATLDECLQEFRRMAAEAEEPILAEDIEGDFADLAMGAARSMALYTIEPEGRE